MAVDKLVDSTQLNSDLTSVANAIRTKGGTSAQLAFPAGFVSAIGDIQTGGGGVPQGEYVQIVVETVTVGANSVTNGQAAKAYLFGLSSLSSEADPSGFIFAYFIKGSSPTTNNANHGTDFSAIKNLLYGETGRYFYRYRSGSIQSAAETSAYDAVLPQGTEYVLLIAKQEAWS